MSSVPLSLMVHQLLEQAYVTHPDKSAVYDGQRRMTYRELYTEAGKLASALSRLGITKGDRAAVCLPNWHEFIVILFALSKLGAILVPFNTRYQAEEAAYILKNSGAKAAFFTSEFDQADHLQLFIDAKRNVPSLEHLFTVRFEAEGLESYQRLLGKADSGEPEPVMDSKEDLFLILYTSGTTGKPKGAMLTHSNLVNVAAAAAEKMRCSAEDVFLIPVPVFHVMGLMFVLRTVRCHGKMVLMENYKAEQALALIQDERVTVHPGVPTMFILELNHPSFASYDLTSLRTGEMAAAPCPVEIVRRIRTEMGCDVLVAYGLTETSANLTLADFSDDDRFRAETVGKAIPGVELKIVDQDRNEAPSGEIGELACRGIGLMKGYYKMPDQTKEAVDPEGWFYTGDLATIDEQGYVRIVGRKKDMIIRGGYNIYAREIEELYYSHPSVLEVAVVGLPDSVLGEISCAAVRLKEGAETKADELKAFLNGKTASYKIPDKIVFTDQLPMTASGKISKVLLQNQLKQDLCEELR